MLTNIIDERKIRLEKKMKLLSKLNPQLMIQTINKSNCKNILIAAMEYMIKDKHLWKETSQKFYVLFLFSQFRSIDWIKDNQMSKNDQLTLEMFLSNLIETTCLIDLIAETEEVYNYLLPKKPVPQTSSTDPFKAKHARNSTLQSFIAAFTNLKLKSSDELILLKKLNDVFFQYCDLFNTVMFSKVTMLIASFNPDEKNKHVVGNFLESWFKKINKNWCYNQQDYAYIIKYSCDILKKNMIDEKSQFFLYQFIKESIDDLLLNKDLKRSIIRLVFQSLFSLKEEKMDFQIDFKMHFQMVEKKLDDYDKKTITSRLENFLKSSNIKTPMSKLDSFEHRFSSDEGLTLFSSQLCQRRRLPVFEKYERKDPPF